MTKTTLIYSSDYDLFTERHMLLPISHPNYNEIIVVVELSGVKDDDNMFVGELPYYDNEGIDIISAYEVDDMRLDIISREYNLSVEEVGT